MLTQATISVLLKKSKNPLDCGSYCPISLLCCSYKILTKALSRRLETAITTIIDPDKTGFIPGRQSYFNMRHLFNILYTDHSTLLPEVIISLDAEKAFDRVEWNYLFTVLEKFGFSPIFRTWIKILYSTPTASVHTNNITSNYLPLQRGTKQGCCLSPFLFDLVFELLAIALCSDERILGVTRREMTHKVSLYVDDLLLYISSPENSIPHLIEVLREFGKFSGYKLNFSKSLLFPINKAAEEIGFDHSHSV